MTGPENDSDWCWCHARWGLAVPATRKSHGTGERAPKQNDICGPCSNRGSAACEKVHMREALAAGKAASTERTA